MKVLLINPPRNLKNPKKQFISLPLGLAYIAAVLEKDGIAVKIIDAIIEGFDNSEEIMPGVYRCGLGLHDLEKIIADYNPDVLGISCMFTSRFGNSVEIAKMTKRVNKNIKVVVGGMHPSCLPKMVLDIEAIDFVIIGEGEKSFLSLIRKLEKNDVSFDKIGGLGFKKNSQYFINANQESIEDLDLLPLPARHLLPMDKYFNVNTGRDALSTESNHTSMITSRGCPYNCTFCSSIGLWGRLWRKRDAENVLGEIQQLVDKYKVKEISFEDDNLSLDYQRFQAICEGIIDRGLKIRWNTPNGISIKNLDRDIIKLMKKSGCSRLNFGIESGDEHILKDIMKKDISLEKVSDVVRWCKVEGINTLGYFVLGMPGETKQSIRRTIDFAKSLALDEIAVFIATPFPGTELLRVCKENNYLIKDYGDMSVEDGIENEIFFETPLLSSQDLAKHRSLFYSEFYKSRLLRNPIYYFKRIISSPDTILRYIKELAASKTN